MRGNTLAREIDKLFLMVISSNMTAEIKSIVIGIVTFILKLMSPPIIDIART